MQERLDDSKLIKSIDVSGMLDAVSDFPAQCREAVKLAKGADLEYTAGAVASIAVFGMGGSGISGDIVKGLFDQVIRMPIVVNKGYSLPGFIGPETLVFAVSYSGETEETLATFALAAERGAKIVAVTSGGRLANMAGDNGYPVIKVPFGLQPRAALGYLSLTVITAIDMLGLVKVSPDIEETQEVIGAMSRNMSLKSPYGSNIAKQTAAHLFDKLPVIYGSEGAPAVAALRWKCQLNENSKTPAFWHQFPELDHNEIVGWQALADVNQKCCVVALRSKGENPRVKKRVEVTLELIKQDVGETLEVWAEGKSDLARLYSLIYLGDFASVYLAILNDVDPTPVERIRILKKKLSEDK